MSHVLTHDVSPAMREADWRQRWRDGHVFGLLRGVSHLKMFLETSRTTFLGLATFVGLVLLAVFVDAVVALPPLGLILADLALIGSLATVAALFVRQLWRNRFHPQRTARLLEERLGIRNSVFINAVEFASAAPRGDSPILRERAIRMAEERAFELSARQILSFRPLGWAMLLLTGALLTELVASSLAPRAFGMVLPRLFDPYGDHPPYTLVEFDVRIAPEPVYHGKPATISVQFGGPEQVEQAAVVFLDGETSQPAAMYPDGEREFALRIDRADVSRNFYIDTPQGRSETFRFEVLEVPFFEEVQIAYRYPDYTGWPPQTHRLDGRGLRALVGTELTVTVRSNLPLRSGSLVVTPAAEEKNQEPGKPVTISLAPTPADPQVVTGILPIERSGRFELKLTSSNGAESIDSVTGPVTAIADRLPSVSIVSPASYVAVVENWKVPVRIEALDDVGLGSIRLYRGVNGWGPHAVELPLDRPRPQAARAKALFDLPALGARAGDVISYYASAYDNHPSGKQFRDSEIHVIEVISESEYQQFARQQYQMDEMIEELQAVREQLDRLEKEREELLEKLAAMRERMESSPEASPEMRQEMEQLEKQLGEYAEGAEQLAEKLQERVEQLKLYEIEEPYLDKLNQMSEQLGRQSQNAQEVGKALAQSREQPADAAARQAFQQAEQKFREQNDPFSPEQKQQLDQTAQDLELMRQADALLASADRMRSIIQRQRELADRLAEFRDMQNLSSQDQVRADRLAKDQELLEQDLQQAVEDMRKAAAGAQEKLPKMAASAQALCDRIAELGISQDQRQAAQQARSGAGSQSHEAADSAARKLESLQAECADCQGMASGMCQGGDGPLKLPKDRIQQALEQLAQGRGVPGLGPPGQGQGQGSRGEGGLGSSGQGGIDGSSPGGTPRFGAGQSFRGSQAPVSVLGPHTMQSSQRDGRAGGSLGDGDGRWTPLGGNDDLRGAETLNPEAREANGSAAGNLRGVPVPYRAAAEAYFRRMAEGK